MRCCFQDNASVLKSFFEQDRSNTTLLTTSCLLIANMLPSWATTIRCMKLLFTRLESNLTHWRLLTLSAFLHSGVETFVHSFLLAVWSRVRVSHLLIYRYSGKYMQLLENPKIFPDNTYSTNFSISTEHINICITKSLIRDNLFQKKYLFLWHSRCSPVLCMGPSREQTGKPAGDSGVEKKAQY